MVNIPHRVSLALPWLNYRRCCGPKFGVHQHLYPDHDNIYSFKIALARVQRTVKSFGPHSPASALPYAWRHEWLRMTLLRVAPPGLANSVVMCGNLAKASCRPAPRPWRR